MRTIATFVLVMFMTALAPTAMASGPRKFDLSLVSEETRVADTTTTTSGGGNSGAAAADGAAAGVGAGLIVGIVLGAAVVVGVILYFSLRNTGDNNNAGVGAQSLNGPAVVRW
mgnify:CR=1 FL=1